MHTNDNQIFVFARVKFEEPTTAAFYRDEYCAQITDFVYIGNIQAAYNEQLLCKLKIGSIVDLSNMEPSRIPKEVKTQCPCTCHLETSHPRSRLTIEIPENDNVSMADFFCDIYKFIDAARTREKGVLVYSQKDGCHAGAAVIQYLMSREAMTFSDAHARLKTRWPTAKIHEKMSRLLKKLELQQFMDIPTFRNRAFSHSSHNVGM